MRFIKDVATYKLVLIYMNCGYEVFANLYLRKAYGR